MRKRFKKKRHSCALCKPYKMEKSCRWKDEEFEQMREFERMKQML